MQPKDPVQKETYTKRINPEQAEYNYPKEDKRKTARQEDLNGSTPKSSL